MKKLILISLFLLALVSCNSPENTFNDLCDKSSAIGSYSVEFVFGPTNQTVKHMYFAKEGGQTMTRSDYEDKNISIVTIVDGKDFYIYYPENDSAIKAPIPSQPDSTDPLYPSPACIPQQFGLTYVGETQIDGIPCALLNYTYGQLKGTQECYDLENGVRLTTANQDTVIWYYKNYSFDVPKDMFSVPATAIVEEKTPEEILGKLQGK